MPRVAGDTEREGSGLTLVPSVIALGRSAAAPNLPPGSSHHLKYDPPPCVSKIVFAVTSEGNRPFGSLVRRVVRKRHRLPRQGIAPLHISNNSRRRQVRLTVAPHKRDAPWQPWAITPSCPTATTRLPCLGLLAHSHDFGRTYWTIPPPHKEYLPMR
jgi:hypothetical protein